MEKIPEPIVNALNKTARAVGRLLSWRDCDVPLHVSDHYRPEDFADITDDPLATPIEQVISWPERAEE